MEMVRQVVCYAIMANEYGIKHQTHQGEVQHLVDISSLGIYFSRSAHLHTFQLSDCISESDKSEVLDYILNHSICNKSIALD